MGDRREVVDAYLRDRAVEFGATAINGLVTDIVIDKDDINAPYIVKYSNYDGKKTGTPEIDIIVGYVRCCWARGSVLGGLGGQKMWDFHYLLQFTQRAPQSFCTDPKFKAILARAKYQQGLGLDKSADKDAGEDGSED